MHLINSTNVYVTKSRISSPFANLNSEPAILDRYLVLYQVEKVFRPVFIIEKHSLDQEVIDA